MGLQNLFPVWKTRWQARQLALRNKSRLIDATTYFFHRFKGSLFWRLVSPMHQASTAKSASNIRRSEGSHNLPHALTAIGLDLWTLTFLVEIKAFSAKPPQKRFKTTFCRVVTATKMRALIFRHPPRGSMSGYLVPGPLSWQPFAFDTFWGLIPCPFFSSIVLFKHRRFAPDFLMVS